MSAPVRAEDLLDRIARLEQTVKDLQQSRTNSIQGMTFQDAQGRIRVRIGPIPGVGHGVVVYNSAGAVTFTQTNA